MVSLQDGKNPEINTNFKGKRVGGFMYIHKSGQKLVADHYSERNRKIFAAVERFLNLECDKIKYQKP